MAGKGNGRYRDRGLLWVLLIGLLTGIGYFSLAQSAHKPNDEIAVFFSERAGLPITDTIQNALSEAMLADGIQREELFVDYLDLARTADNHQRHELVALLKHKFAKRQFGLIIAVHRRAYEFLVTEGPELFSSTPLIAWAGSVNEPTVVDRPGLRIQENPSPRLTIDLALRLFPQTRHLLIVTGVDDPLFPYLRELKSNLGILPARLTVEFTDDKSFEQTLARVAELPTDSVVIFGTYWRGADGRAITPIEAAQHVAAKARVPAFAVTWDGDIGQGFLGGYVVDPVATARIIAAAATEHMTGKRVLSAPMTVLPAAGGVVFDWRQMQRWGIDTSALPSDSRIINRPLPFWQSDRNALALIICAVLTVGLLWSRRNNHLVGVSMKGDDHDRRRSDQLMIANRQLIQLSFVDELTGLANRRRLDDLLTQECQRANRSGQPLSLIMIDVDHFKAFNDTYGHLAGDDCLRALAEIFRSLVQRPADLASRFGGEEFLLILPETPHHGAIEIVYALHAAIAKSAIPHLASPTAPQITCSSGVLTTQAPPNRRPLELLAEVDRQLYRSKTDGRNRYTALDLSSTAIDATGSSS